MAKLGTEIEVTCPCCKSALVIDTALPRVVRHVEPERVDKPRGEFFHTNWTGRGGDTSSSSYNV